MKIVPVVVAVLIGSRSAQPQTPFPVQTQLTGLLRHGISWHYHWKTAAQDRPVLRRLTAGERLRGRSLLIDGPEGRQVWSFIPSLKMHIAFVASPSDQQWKLLSVADGVLYAGEITEVVRRYLDFYYQSGDNRGCAIELLPKVTRPPSQRTTKQNLGTSLPLARACPPGGSVSYQTVDFELTVDLDMQVETDAQCQRESAIVTRRWIAEYDRSMNGRFVIPACSSADPQVFVLLEPRASEANILVLNRDIGGHFVFGKAIERRETVSELAKRIGTKSSLSFSVPK